MFSFKNKDSRKRKSIKQCNRILINLILVSCRIFCTRTINYGTTEGFRLKLERSFSNSLSISVNLEFAE